MLPGVPAPMLVPHIIYVQRKCYPREWWIVGRVRVTLKNPDGSLVNPDIPNRTWRLL